MSSIKPSPNVSPALGKQPAKKFMTRKVVYVSPNASLETAMKIMITHKVSGLPVVDDAGHCVGVLSELDVMIQGAAESLTAKIKYKKPVIGISEDTPFHDILIKMAKNRIKRLPVLGPHNQLLGVISRGDLMKAIYRDYTGK